MKAILALLSAAMMTYGASAQNVLTGATKLLIANHQLDNSTETRAASQRVYTIILLNQGAQVSDETLSPLGIEVEKRSGTMIFAYVPISSLEALGQIEGIRMVDTGRSARLQNDNARQSMSVDQAHAKAIETGENPGSGTYRGKGVLVAVLDTEIDPGHPAFRDAEGKLRIRQYTHYDYNKNTKETTKIVYGEDELDKAIEANRERRILSEAHGTHVASIAAGCTDVLPASDPNKKYYGMAPEADLLFYEVALNDENTFISSLDDAFRKADEWRMPVVANMSIGKNDARLDATDAWNVKLQALVDAYDMRGKIICLCAGNEGEDNISAQLDCTQPIVNNTWTKQYVMRFKAGMGFEYADGKILHLTEQENSFYSLDEKQMAVQYDIYDSNENLIVSTPLFEYDGKEDATIWQDKGTFSTDENYQITVSNAYETTSSKRFFMTSEIKVITPTSKDSRVIATLYTKENDAKIDACVYGNQFVNLPGFTPGNNKGSISQMACSENVISVGAYNTRDSFINLLGSKVDNLYGGLNNISTFSSFCDSHYSSRKLPDILTPGACILAAIHHSCEKESGTTVGTTTYDGVEYLWGENHGTSMATPAAAGTIALWLQANPTLTVAEVREVMSQTSTYDSYCKAAPERAGMGKLNALLGLEYVLQNTAISSVSADDGTDGPAKIIGPDGRIVIRNGAQLYDVLGILVK